MSDEYLAPGCNAYDQWLQHQTYDLTPHLRPGQNLLSIMLGNGWYGGRYGMQEHLANPKTYGDEFSLICKLHLTLANGESLLVPTDATWHAAPAPVLAGGIYDGETYDARLLHPLSASGPVFGVKPLALDVNKLQARLSLPVGINQELKPIAVLHTPAGETVLDMGQNMVGWVRFKTRAPAGSRIYLQFGEVLQGGNFYRENLRTAKAEYIYIANGAEIVAPPHFFFCGFRYVSVSGWSGELDPDDFTGCVVHSQLDETGHIVTSNDKVNQLFRNALWGQKGNFLDIPTDCPQRDERLGWTGDTQMFSRTACFNMDSAAFFDCAKEQAPRGGMVPFIIPAANMPGGSSAWGDVATILPWTVYEFLGDPRHPGAAVRQHARLGQLHPRRR